MVGFLNTKTRRHEVAIAAGKITRSKYREASIAVRQISPSGYYREASIAEGKYHKVNIAQLISPLGKYRRQAIIAKHLSPQTKIPCTRSKPYRAFYLQTTL
jgi:hypothetical protein